MVRVVLDGEAETSFTGVVILVCGCVENFSFVTQMYAEKGLPGQSTHLYRSPKMVELHMVQLASCHQGAGDAGWGVETGFRELPTSTRSRVVREKVVRHMGHFDSKLRIHLREKQTIIEL